MNNPHVWVQHYDGMAGRFFKQYAHGLCALVSPKDHVHRGKKGRTWFARISHGAGGAVPYRRDPDSSCDVIYQSGFDTPEAAMLWADNQVAAIDNLITNQQPNGGSEDERAT